MANETGMEETAPRWTRAAHGARGAMENNGVVGAAPPHSATPEPPLHGYREPGKPSLESCPWSCSEGRSEPPGVPAGCPFLPAPQDALRHPEDPRLPPPLPKNGQPKGWAEPPERRPRWAEAVLGPLAPYSHGYRRYPAPFPAESEAHGVTDAEPKTFGRCPFLLSSALPAEPRFGGTEVVTGADWHLGSYVPTWEQPLYLGVPARGNAAPNPFGVCAGAGNRVRAVLWVPRCVGVCGEGVPWGWRSVGIWVRGDLGSWGWRSMGIWGSWGFGAHGDGDPWGFGFVGFGAYGGLGFMGVEIHGDLGSWGFGVHGGGGR